MMQTGFYHPDRFNGVPWFPMSEPTSAYLAGLPEGTVQNVPQKPGDGYDYDPGSNTWVFTPAAPTNEQVNAERDRRIEAGSEFTLSDGSVIGVTGRTFDQMVLLSNKLAAEDLVANGADPDDDLVIPFRDRDNENWMLSPNQAVELYTLGSQWITAIMQVSWHMKDGTGPFTDGIPEDFTSDSYWPAPEDL